MCIRDRNNIAGGASGAGLQQALRGIDEGIAKITANPLLVLVHGDALTELQRMRAETVAAFGQQTGMLANADRWWSETTSSAARTSDEVEAMRQSLVAKQD